ncbi:endolytic transglycosylase MltG [Desmospora profundinema]|uniref:Cell division protein YceG involved in septum cleavage/predicted MFS family arabinose efflux permease n=1 Tax=Desmospora profundinema TaxID=1571184 RepID=A0ABU1ILV0_9BACL|nr:endolytic transglycosylase MltG [Desmospora profundinema]MDR6225713.1 cell division protein YceG involved in septum cleavage/predicted MFS family arabinose efflux permease [Desmospora profundinema]
MSFDRNPNALTRKEKYRWVKYGGYHPIVWFLIMGTAITRTASFMSLPFLAIYLSKFLNLDPLLVGITLGMSGLTGSMGGFIGGYLSDRWGRQRIMLFSFFVWTGVFFGFLFADSFWSFLILNSLNGLCRAFFEPSSQALMADVSTPKQRLKIFSYRYIAINIGMVTGPMLGSLLFGTLGLAIFLYTGMIYAVYFLLLCIFLFLHHHDLRKAQESDPNHTRFRECWRTIRQDQALRYFVLAGVLFFMVYSQIESSLPLYLATQSGTMDHLFPILLSINAAMVILLQAFITRWVENKHILTSLIIGTLLSAGGLLSFALGNQDAAFITGVVLITFGEILIFPISSLFIDRIAKDGMRGTYYGANNLGQLGLFLGPILGGLLLHYFGGETLWWMMAFLTMHLILFHAMGYRAFSKKQGVTILDIVRRVLIDLRLITPIKTIMKSVPLLSLTFLCLLLPYSLFEQGIEGPPRSQTVEVTIPEHATVGDVGRELEIQKIIQNHRFFPLYAEGYSLFHSFSIQPGTYRIEPDMDLQEVMAVLSRGTFQVDIPDGATVEKIAELLEDHGISKQEVYEAANQTDYHFSFLRDIPTNPRPYRLEGYMVPGSYEFNRGVEAEEIIQVILERFEALMTQEVRTRLRQGNLSMDQWVTVASILELQASDQNPKPSQAREIYDRLNRGGIIELPPLPSPYSNLNYSQTEGLPPGPLNNPGTESLNAALYPKNHTAGQEKGND